jgi:hypothetical protein
MRCLSDGCKDAHNIKSNKKYFSYKFCTGGPISDISLYTHISNNKNFHIMLATCISSTSTRLYRRSREVLQLPRTLNGLMNDTNRFYQLG